MAHSVTQVVNTRNEDYDVYIGRGSFWGNPFKIGKDGDRADVIRKFENYASKKLSEGQWSPEDFKELYGQKLGCFCHPKPCHGDVLAVLADEFALV